MVNQRDRVVKITEYIESLGITINIGKTKARGNRGFFQERNKHFRIDIAKNLPEATMLSVLIHEFAHYIHYCHDSSLNSLEPMLGNLNDVMQEELIEVTVNNIPKTTAKALFDKKKEISDDINSLSELIKRTYSDFKTSKPYTKLERGLELPVKYLLKYDKIRFLNLVYSVESLEKDFNYLSPCQVAYIRLKSKQRCLKRINSKISKLNKYYNRSTELFARFMELYALNREKAHEIAPTVTKTMNNILKDNKIPKLTKFLSLLNI